MVNPDIVGGTFKADCAAVTAPVYSMDEQVPNNDVARSGYPDTDTA